MRRPCAAWFPGLAVSGKRFRSFLRAPKVGFGGLELMPGGSAGAVADPGRDDVKREHIHQSCLPHAVVLLGAECGADVVRRALARLLLSSALDLRERRDKSPNEEGGPPERQRNEDRVRPRAEVTRLAGSRPRTPGESN